MAPEAQIGPIRRLLDYIVELIAKEADRLDQVLEAGQRGEFLPAVPKNALLEHRQTARGEYTCLALDVKRATESWANTEINGRILDELRSLIFAFLGWEGDWLRTIKEVRLQGAGIRPGQDCGGMIVPPRPVVTEQDLGLARAIFDERHQVLAQGLNVLTDGLDRENRCQASRAAPPTQTEPALQKERLVFDRAGLAVWLGDRLFESVNLKAWTTLKCLYEETIQTGRPLISLRELAKKLKERYQLARDEKTIGRWLKNLPDGLKECVILNPSEGTFIRLP